MSWLHVTLIHVACSTVGVSVAIWRRWPWGAFCYMVGAVAGTLVAGIST